MNKQNDQFSSHERSLDQLSATIIAEVARVKEAGRVNTLEAYHAHIQRQKTIRASWHRLQHACQELEQAINALPEPLVWNQIVWAQTMLEMPNLAFLELDTTGLGTDDELIRFTLIDATGQVIEDGLVRPMTQELGPQARWVNGIMPEQLADAPSLAEVWPRIQRALRGRYILSFGLEWDETQLEKAASRHGLPPLMVIGDCLQRHATSYYHREYGLKLAELCARAGSPLPEHPHQTSLDRARGQRAVLHAFARAVTDVRPPAYPDASGLAASRAASEGDDFDPFLDSVIRMPG